MPQTDPKQHKENTPSPIEISQLARLLSEEKLQIKRNKQYASAKEVLKKLATGGIIVGAFLAPKQAYLAAKVLMKNDAEFVKWKQYNVAYLRQTLKRMAKQKLIYLEEKNGQQQIAITERGKKRVIEYALEDIIVPKTPTWDKKWRIIIYDIPTPKKQLQEQMRRTLKHLGFLQIQKSIYLTPYPCYKEIEFLRSYYGIGEYIKYMLVTKIEDDSAYKQYFGLK